MAIYEITSDDIRKMDETTFSQTGLRERTDLQRLLRRQIEVISPGTLVIAEEFGDWEDSRRRIDLLGIDKDANLVVIELKRTESGGHMDLQAIRYAAMVSTMTFDKVIDVFGKYLESIDSSDEPRESLLKFLEWDEPDENDFAQCVRIVLASADFSKELTTAVMWLNEQGLEISCVRLKPYSDGDRVLLDVQQVIPLPEAQQYQIQLREKTQKSRVSHQKGRDYTKYDVTINDKTYERLNKGRMAHTILKHLCDSGVKPDAICKAATVRKGNVFRSAEGEFDSAEEFVAKCTQEEEAAGRRFDDWRYFTEEDQLVVCDGRTYCISKQWGGRLEGWFEDVLKAFPGYGVNWSRSEIEE